MKMIKPALPMFYSEFMDCTVDANGKELTDNEIDYLNHAAQMYDELLDALRYLGDEKNWIDSDDGLTLKRPGGGRKAGIVLYSYDIKPWAFLRDLLAKVEGR